ncbi:RNA polymerase sigma factor, sigma-70 family [Arthrobacter sp. yr096]|uniref:sigma-70 family RNA polymerase sigma factor n=1 Tax=Arthrobacter sp. yr096 TaxID=1761750 RepID=UPI0008CE9C5D|nr:sigma-70 family RNA polymerase sigma factor [Arthrobacter sp. yr096]SEJ64228.1 RNA polymerase sigma factor, sigma-70 family [Arthrobacter sp. yr096]
MAHGSHASRDAEGDTGSDRHLIELVRGGDMSAFDGLYGRHLSIAYTVARRNVDNLSDAEDVVAEAFQSVLHSIVAGKGPGAFFRAYLLSTVTRLSHQRNRKAGKVLASGDDSVLDQTVLESDAVISAFESRTVAKAFHALPERWQAVLWYMDVERMKPAAVAPILGLTPNAVSALAVRAREGLRRQYLQSHVADQADGKCAEFASKLGSFLRGGLSSAAERKVRNHLHGCSMCTAALAELNDVQGSMRAVLLPLVTGIPLAMWAGKGAAVGLLGGMAPAKVALAVHALAQPAVMALFAAAGVGLMLGAGGAGEVQVPEVSTEQRAVETAAAQGENGLELATPAPAQTGAPAPAPVAPMPAESASSTSVPPPTEPLPALEEQSETLVPAPEEPLPPPGVLPEPTMTTPAPVSPPAKTPAPVPSAVPSAATAATISGFVRENRGRGDSSGTAMEIDFAASGTGPLGSGKAVFSVEGHARILESSLRVPDGWACSMEGQSVVMCVTDSVQRGSLHFHVTADSGRSKDGGVLNYSLSGTGLVPGQFEYQYQAQ